MIQVQFEAHGFNEPRKLARSLEAVPRVGEAVLFDKAWWKVSGVSWDISAGLRPAICVDIAYVRRADTD